jgi:hypothetical protein
MLAIQCAPIVSLQRESGVIVMTKSSPRSISCCQSANSPRNQSLSASFTRRQRVLLACTPILKSQLFRHHSEAVPYQTFKSPSPPRHRPIRPVCFRLPLSFPSLSSAPSVSYTVIKTRHPLLPTKLTQSPVTGNTPRHWNHHVSAVRPCANP